VVDSSPYVFLLVPFFGKNGYKKWFMPAKVKSAL